jgi:hypothetical protein
MDIKEAIEHCWDRKDYPEVFRDDAGLDISIPGFITRGSWIRNNSPRTVTLDVTTYRGVSWNAIHYYGNITIEGVSFSPEDSPNTYTMCKETYEAEEKNPLAAGFYRIELVRPVTSEEIEEDGSQGWKGWGGEIYFKKYGEIMMDVVDKKKARREAKKHIENELQDQL